MPSALFSTNSDATNQGYDGAESEVLNFALRSASGVRKWQLQVFSASGFNTGNAIIDNPPRQSTGATELVLDNLNGIQGQLVPAASPVSAIACALPAGEFPAWIVRSIVNDGFNDNGAYDPSLVSERMVVIRDGNGNRAVPPTERTQYHDDGWTEALESVRDSVQVPEGGGAGRIGDLGLEFSPTFLWNGNGGLVDESGNGNDLVLDAGATLNVDVEPGSRGLFLNSNHRHRSASSGVYRHLGDMTLITIFRLINGAPYADEGFIVACAGESDSSTENALYGFRIKDRGIGTYSLEWFQEDGPGTNRTYEVSSADGVIIQDDTTVMVTWVRENSRVRAYVNRDAFGSESPVLPDPTDGSLSIIRTPGFTTPNLGAVLKAIKVIPSPLDLTGVRSEWDIGMGPRFGAS